MQCKDLYTNLASDMFSVPCSQVTPEMRRVAKHRALAGSYTARISGVQVVDQACCKEGKVRVDVVVDHVEPQRKVCKHRALGAAFGMPDIEVTPNPNPADFTKIEERVSAMYTSKSDKQRADEYEAMLLKAFPHVLHGRRERGRPLMASDFDPSLRAMRGVQAKILKVLRGRTPIGPLSRRLDKLVELADDAKWRGDQLQRVSTDLAAVSKRLYQATMAVGKLRDVGQMVGLPWNIGFDDHDPATRLEALQRAIRGRRFICASHSSKVKAEAADQVAEAKRKARAAVNHAAFAAGMIGLVVGGLLGVIFAG
ncbi:DNA polymerase [Pseudomonas phage 20Aug401]|uniref:DNA polymerase n=1 Tax=Pseudomonas phage 20Aug401 TaxID=3028482 RepID=A0AAF0FJ12_9CAUD|nr:DNA polymerase [Pseudomonas phage 20Aug401]